MTNTKEFNLLFACTSDFFQYATVTALSVIENLPEDIKVNVHFFYADIIKPILSQERRYNIEKVQLSLKRKNVSTFFYNVQKYMPIFEELPCGMWEKNISLTHYMYLLAPIILPQVDKVLYLDTDMLANSDLSTIYFEDMGNKLITMINPSGIETIKDMSNSGLVILNLEQWRKEGILDKLIELGKTLENSGLCDQHLLYEYFTKRNPERLSLIDSMYNVFPQYFSNKNLSEIFVIHFTAPGITKPWFDLNQNVRESFLWWHYAKKTCYGQNFVLEALRQKSDSLKKEEKYFLDENNAQEYIKLKEFIKNERICFWGNSIFLETFLFNEDVNTKNILGIIDKNPTMLGNFVKNLKVFSIEEISKLKPKYIISTIKNNHRKNYLEIKEFLNKNHPEIELLPSIFENN